MTKTALVTGSNGFIGSHLINELLKRNYNVHCMVRSNSNLKWLKGCSIKYVLSDLTNLYDIENAVQDADEIYHLAGIVRTLNNKEYYRINSCGTKNFVDAVKKFNPTLKKFIYVSSQAAWGPQESGPVSDYGKSKKEGEVWVRNLKNYSIVRPVAVYGPRDNDFLSVFKMAQKGFFLKPRFAERLSFIHIDDCVKGIINVSVNDEKFLSDGSNYSWEQVAEILSKTLNKKVRCLTLPHSFIKLTGLIGDISGKIKGTSAKLNSDKVKEMLAANWVVHETQTMKIEIDYKLEKGFKDTYNWYLKMGWM